MNKIHLWRRAAESLASLRKASAAVEKEDVDNCMIVVLEAIAVFDKIKKSWSASNPREIVF